MAGLLSWIGRGIGLRDGPFWGAWFGGETWAGKPVNEVNSLNLSAWWRCVRLYADVVGAMPFKFYERTAGDGRLVNTDHRVAGLIGMDPNADQTPQEFWSAMAASMAVQGNAYAEKRFIGANLAALDLMPFNTRPDRTQNTNGDLEYFFNDRGKEVRLPRDKVLHVRGFTMGRSDVGLSPLAAARQTLGITLATEEAVGKTFAKGMRASGFFTLPAGMKSDEKSREEFRKKFIDPISGNNADVHWGLLEAGIDAKTINISPKDAEMLASRGFNVEETCRFMGVPPIMAGHSAQGQTMWGTGVESIWNMWLTLGLDSFLRYFEHSVRKWLLSPADRQRFYPEFERDSLLRLDSAARAEFMAKLIQNGLMMPNEGRKKMNQPPGAGGDVLLVNATLIPLTDAGRLTRQLPAPDAVGPGPKPEQPK